MAQVVLRRELNYCVVDEGDSVLIDEARAPLAISGKTNFGYLSAHLGCISRRACRSSSPARRTRRSTSSARRAGGGVHLLSSLAQGGVVTD